MRLQHLSVGRQVSVVPESRTINIACGPCIGSLASSSTGEGEYAGECEGAGCSASMRELVEVGTGHTSPVVALLDDAPEQERGVVSKGNVPPFAAATDVWFQYRLSEEAGDELCRHCFTPDAVGAAPHLRGQEHGPAVNTTAPCAMPTSRQREQLPVGASARTYPHRPKSTAAVTP